MVVSMIKRSSLSLLLFVGLLMVPVMSWAQNSLANPADSKEAPATEAATVAEAPVSATEAAAPEGASPIPKELIKIGTVSAKYDSMMPKVWAIPYMPAGDTVIADNPIRAALAKEHIWYTVGSMTEFAVNLKHLNQPPSAQVYVGEKPSYFMVNSQYIT